MPERRGGVGEHPSLEVLSAYVDGTLDVRERGDVETHVAACEDCYELVTEVVASEEDIDAEGGLPSSAAPVPVPPASRDVAPMAQPSPKVLPFARRKWVIGAAAGLAAAAALVLTVQLGMFSSETDAAVGKLVAAVGNHRTFEGRLSGGFAYGPLISATRSGPAEANLALLAAAGELQRVAESSPSADALHAFGVSQLLLGKHAEAVTTLERAIAADPRASYLSDLAAAYIERARHLDTAEDWPRSLAAAEKAIRADPGLLSAWFNRACAIESFGVAAPSRDAWNDYLQRDGASAWAEEARRRLAGLNGDPSASPRARHPASQPDEAVRVVRR